MRMMPNQLFSGGNAVEREACRLSGRRRRRRRPTRGRQEPDQRPARGNAFVAPAPQLEGAGEARDDPADEGDSAGAARSHADAESTTSQTTPPASAANGAGVCRWSKTRGPIQTSGGAMFVERAPAASAAATACRRPAASSAMPAGIERSWPPTTRAAAVAWRICSHRPQAAARRSSAVDDAAGRTSVSRCRIAWVAVSSAATGVGVPALGRNVRHKLYEG